MSRFGRPPVVGKGSTTGMNGSSKWSTEHLEEEPARSSPKLKLDVEQEPQSFAGANHNGHSSSSASPTTPKARTHAFVPALQLEDDTQAIRPLDANDTAQDETFKVGQPASASTVPQSSEAEAGFTLHHLEQAPPVARGPGSSDGSDRAANGHATPIEDLSASTSTLGAPERFATPRLPQRKQRPAFMHAQVSRLRSISAQSSDVATGIRRLPSQTSLASVATGASDLPRRQGPVFSPSVSVLDHLSEAGDSSLRHDRLLDVTGQDQSGQTSAAASTASLTGIASALQRSDPFRWTPLRKVSARAFQTRPRRSAQQPTNVALSHLALLGAPTTLAANGFIAIGHERGWVSVFDYTQTLRCIAGSEAIANEAGAVTALAISHDHSFLAVGHANGAIHLYDVTKPAQPARSVPPTTLDLVVAGRAEGHLIGSKITRLGFVGLRHTAIVSSDESGLTFYHSLGKVFGLANTDVVRILGQYPSDSSRIVSTRRPSDPQTTAIDHVGFKMPRRRKPISVIDMAPLPLGPLPHTSDDLALVAIITASKILIAGLKPSPRTWWRAVREDSKPDAFGALAWFPCRAALADEAGDAARDPLLAYAWGNQVYFVHVAAATPAESPDKKAAPQLIFRQGSSWQSRDNIIDLLWISPRALLVVSTVSMEIIDPTTKQRTARGRPNFAFLPSGDPPRDVVAQRSDGEASLQTLRAHKGKVFWLTSVDLQVGIPFSWADRVLELVNSSRLLEAIELTTAYYKGEAQGGTSGLPEDDALRRDTVRPKLFEIMNASLRYCFSEERMISQHASSDGRGVDRSSLFEGLVGVCTRACLALNEHDYLFNDVFEAYLEHGIESIYLARIEPFILADKLPRPPIPIVQRLVDMHERAGEEREAEQILWHVDADCLDIDQAIQLCRRHNLQDALIYVYSQSMLDYITPLVELIGMIAGILRRREDALHNSERNDAETTASQAYKIFPYLSDVLSGLVYPSKRVIEVTAANRARRLLYGFLLSRRSIAWPRGAADSVLTTTSLEDEPIYPYATALLRFDAEAMLDVLDLAFEDSFLNQESSRMDTLSRQGIIDVLLDVASQTDTRLLESDLTFLHIFVARNLPKYPQFISLSRTAYWTIFQHLTSDPDLSTYADRQLAIEYLLSVYAPDDHDEESVRLLESAGFYRILKSRHRHKRDWPAYVEVLLADEDDNDGLFADLDAALSDTNVTDIRSVQSKIFEGMPTLIAHGAQEAVAFVETKMSSNHNAAIAALHDAPNLRYAYLRALLHPLDDLDNPLPDVAGIVQLEPQYQDQFLDDLCEYDPGEVLQYLTYHSRAATVHAQEICRSHNVYDASVWLSHRLRGSAAALTTFSWCMEHATDPLSDAYGDGEALIGQACKVACEVCAADDQEQAATDAWHALLSSIMSTAASTSSKGELYSLTTSVLNQALLALVANATRQRVALPALMRQLIEDLSRSRSSSAGIQYSAFRTVVSTMIDTCRSETDLLTATSNLTAQDVWDQTELLFVERELGWRSRSRVCSVCQSELVERKQESDFDLIRPRALSMVSQASQKSLQSPKMSLKGKEVDWGAAPRQPETEQKSIVIMRDGRVMHAHCFGR
ncbi:uncharacterized protein L969DRAFT_611396 [Mixia osmundae IAM 14324]|uniref:Vacuolar protein sorting-associated protein 8 central domain-containing protein n=1 Tax=Mixia osmundae (strain CBS 9802 / IAM 14324 / JCM 22182 / KY 12970) TaxID=764103 RepID=G7E2G2_MIXOS|nr:uncharacterized protein L969DRAFT_611396 [Mixia osmundae IAM 14324]KEI36892.1 hypothetical protein L969DRAFT_611396 [Mixia osmundae IAM 14324]GAA97022.1 hypothetical protein E5Q_03697 [Mixia osmundae IAM 14324]